MIVAGVCAWTLGAALFALRTEDRIAEGTPGLEVVLERLARVAELYRDEALSFTCDESIQYSAGRTASLHRFRYIYVASAGELQDRRELIGKSATGRVLDSAGAPNPIHDLPGMLLRPYSWVFVFAPQNQRHYRYAVEGVTRVLGTATLRVRFEALPPYVRDVNEWSGTAFVDRVTFQPARVEAHHVSEGASGPVRYTTDFDLVESDMRFPGQVRIRSEIPRYSVVQTYKRYRFFGVRTREEIQRFVLGAR